MQLINCRIKANQGKHSLSKAGCHCHAYVIMTPPLHLLIASEDKAQLTKFMQSMANHQRTGTIWEGRF